MKLSLLAALMLSTCAPTYAQDRSAEVIEDAHNACHRHINPIDGINDQDGFYAASGPRVNALFAEMQRQQTTQRERDAIAALQQQKGRDRASILDAVRSAQARDIRKTTNGYQ